LKRVSSKKIADKPRKTSPASAPRSRRAKATPKPGLRIVGMGGSAGGLEAFEQFFAHMPADSGFAFVLVPHLDPTHKGIMAEILQRQTRMPVVQIEDGMRVKENCVYVIPPNTDLSILRGKLQLLEPTAPRGLRMSIDFFFRQLAEDQREKAVGIVLSGMGTDGSLGLKAIKEHAGLAMAQEPASAKYNGMPQSAVSTGLVDIVAKAEDLSARLIQVIAHVPAKPRKEIVENEDFSNVLEKVFVVLRLRTGNDFSCYKKSTICRRIERRMGVHQFDRLSHYLRYLQENPQEVDLLHKELLIGVTNFFRDPGLFEYLRTKALPDLFKARRRDTPLRIWTPACSTGEEAFSLAMILKETLETTLLKAPSAFQIFATDIDKGALSEARQGLFSSNLALDVSKERLDRFFDREDDNFRVKKEIRDTIIFAPQNILVDPPFTKLDVLCCRNFLIYINSETQKKVLPLFHYGLNPGGLLILGTAEGASGFGHLFAPLDKKWKVFRTLVPAVRPAIEIPAALSRHTDIPGRTLEKSKETTTDMSYAVQRALLDAYAPASLVVNAAGDIAYVNGHTGRYLEQPSGKVNVNVFAMARQGLRDELSIAIHDAAKRASEVTIRNVKVKTNGGFAELNLVVKPLDSPAMHGMFLVIFEELRKDRPKATDKKKPAPAHAGNHDAELHDELRRTKQLLQNTVEEMEGAQEELRSANEELQSYNEELQSTNEELTTSKEELQSLNEEMQTVNAELQSKIDELSQSNNDMKNLLNGIDVATIFLDNDLNIKRFTPQAVNIAHLIAGDVGRPFAHIVASLKYDRVLDDAKAVLDTLLPREAQVQADNDHWYHMRVLPYRTTDNVIDGVVMTFTDISAQKKIEEILRERSLDLEQTRKYAENVVAAVQIPLVVLDDQLRIVSASNALCETFKLSAQAIEGRSFCEACGTQGNDCELTRLLGEVLHRNAEFKDYRFRHDFPVVGHKQLLLSARAISQASDGTPSILLTLVDITETDV
jgi:two-component system, chemotaxis family, CheB/CheR fusion protein